MANVLLFIGRLGVSELFLILMIMLPLLLLWLYVVIEILIKPFKNDIDKVVWLLVVVLLPVLGFILYYAFGRSRLARS